MKKVLRILILVLMPFFIMAQTTIFTENCGNPAATTSAATYTGWQNNASLTYTASATSPDVRTTSPSSTYTGASGGGNIFFTNSLGIYVQISGINTTNYTNLALSLGILKSTIASNGSEMVIETSSDGTTYTALSYTMATGSGTSVWTLVSPTGAIPATSNLRIRFRLGTNNGTQFRLDDIKLVGCLIPSSPTPTYTTPACTSSVISLPSNSYIETTSSGTSTSVSTTISSSGTYYARTVSVVAGCTSVWSKTDTFSVVINSMPTISINPSSVTAVHVGATYWFIAHANYPFVWQVSTNGGSSWSSLTIASPYSTRGDTLKIYPANHGINGYRYRIASTNSPCVAYSSSGTLSIATELPVKLTAFYGQKYGNKNVLYWVTASEIDNDRFEVERADSALNWSSIGIVKGMGTTTSQTEYSFIDGLPIQGSNYYRLKQVDIDGQYAYSDIISITNDTDVKYYNLLGIQEHELLPYKFYIEVINGVGRKILYTKQ